MSLGSRKSSVYGIISIITILFGYIAIANAQATTDLQQKIDQRNSDIQALEKEIAGYQGQIDVLNSQASTLSSTIKSLDLTEKKLAADIAVTQDKITAKDLEIAGLSGNIGSKEANIADDRRLISHSLVTISQSERTLTDILLNSQSIAEAWNNANELALLGNSLSDRIQSLGVAKAGLEKDKSASENARAELVDLNKQLNGQKAVVAATTQDKSALLKSTKQSEAQYQATLAEKLALKNAFEQEVLDYESQLKTKVNAANLPHTGSGVLSWPLDDIYITQYFGNTPFSTANPQIYNGKGHTGVDFRASIGTAVRAALAGVVSGVGNTDLVPGCYSYGKWIMIRHNNGLSTLYAHLSVPSVKQGDTVSTGDVIGYSGNTGYTTGPHLHFGVYATEGVVIRSFDESKNCHGAILPLAPFSAYLNPLSYL